MTETVQPLQKESPGAPRPPVKWMITVKETDTTVVVQFPVINNENETDSEKINSK